MSGIYNSADIPDIEAVNRLEMDIRNVSLGVESFPSELRKRKVLVRKRCFEQGRIGRFY